MSSVLRKLRRHRTWRPRTTGRIYSYDNETQELMDRARGELVRAQSDLRGAHRGRYEVEGATSTEAFSKLEECTLNPDGSATFKGKDRAGNVLICGSVPTLTRVLATQEGTQLTVGDRTVLVVKDL